MQQHWSWDLAVEAICKLSFYKNIMNLFFNKKKEMSGKDLRWEVSSPL